MRTTAPSAARTGAGICDGTTCTLAMAEPTNMAVITTLLKAFVVVMVWLRFVVRFFSQDQFTVEDARSAVTHYRRTCEKFTLRAPSSPNREDSNAADGGRGDALLPDQRAKGRGVQRAPVPGFLFVLLGR